MCYNVLCDKYATRQMYGYCPSWALEWEYRKKGILDEIRHYAADIISLQVRMFMNSFNSVLLLTMQDKHLCVLCACLIFMPSFAISSEEYLL
jgi:uncharacterized protein YdhG (YjbR/CyaY superfamily)